MDLPPIPLANIVPTHNCLRSLESLDWFLDRIKEKNFDRPHFVKLIYFGENKYLLHDGHHYCSALWVDQGPDGFLENYLVYDLYWVDYTAINFDANFVTPFDPRKEVRVPDFFGFKDEALDIYRNDGRIAATKFILDNPRRYKEPRTAHKIWHLRS